MISYCPKVIKKNTISASVDTDLKCSMKCLEKREAKVLDPNNGENCKLFDFDTESKSCRLGSELENRGDMRLVDQTMIKVSESFMKN